MEIYKTEIVLVKRAHGKTFESTLEFSSLSEQKPLKIEVDQMSEAIKKLEDEVAELETK